MNYQLRMFYADAPNQTAGTKATKDCSEILTDLGYRNFDVPIYMNKGALPNMLSMLKHFSLLILKLGAEDTIVLQYPLLGINKWLKYIVGLLGLRGCRKVCLIHDLDSLRQVHHAWTLDQEIERLNAFDVVIAHNVQMKSLLEENGLKNRILSLELFDYLIPASILEIIAKKNTMVLASVGKRNSIAFAGNLGKSEFVAKLPKLQGLEINLYGPGYVEKVSEGRLHWAGTFDANVLPGALNGDFGLIWDGEEINRCTGNLGNYLQYNNPHKASLYLLSQLPLIAPKGTAIGKFIEAHAIGITVNSLLELPEFLEGLDEAAYQVMKSNIKEISGRIASGDFLGRQIANL